MKNSFLFFFVIIIIYGGTATCEELLTEISINHVENKEGILLNPNMGFYVAGWNHRQREDLPSYTNLVYQRFMWKDLEPEKGVLNLKEIKAFISYWKNNDCRVAFRIISSNTRGTQTPDYVFDEDVPAVVHNPANGIQKDPVYWDPKYIEIYTKFIHLLGKELNNGDGIEFIDMGGIGVFGEMHLGLHIPGMWTNSELKAYNFSEESYFTAYKKMIAAYKSSFPKTRLFLNISRYNDITKYAAEQGIGLRFDGLAIKNNSTQGIVSNAFNKFALNRGVSQGVPTMYEFAKKETDPENIEKCFKIAFSNPISYIHINLGQSNSLDKIISEIIKKYAATIGYRLYLKTTTIAEFSSSKPIVSIKQIWKNKGTVNPYRDFIFRFSIFKFETEFYSQDIKPEIGTSLWQPEQDVIVTINLKIPMEMIDGIYNFTLSVIDTNSNETIKIANIQNFDNGFFKLFTIKIEDRKVKIIHNAG